ncbi:MAG: hypothetical protein JWR85_3559 [Marmoricola sp.]|nr:hypothetical protein [Marmoricola sp.]
MKEEVTAMVKSLRRSPAQLEMLRRVVGTRGGGLSGYREPERTWSKLHTKGLVQGKSGQPDRIVHTDLGLAVVRAMEATGQ